MALIAPMDSTSNFWPTPNDEDPASVVDFSAQGEEAFSGGSSVAVRSAPWGSGEPVGVACDVGVGVGVGVSLASSVWVGVGVGSAAGVGSPLPESSSLLTEQPA